MNQYYKLLDNENEDCIICMEPIENRYTTKCNHDFCKSCIKQWVKESDSCPLCRVEDILIRCKNCREEGEINKNEVCDECQINITEAKFDADILIKMKREAKKEWKKLPLWKRIKIKTKLKCKKLFRKTIKLGKFIIKIPYHLLRFFLGKCKFKNQVTYKIGLAILYGYIAYQFPFLSIPYLIFGLFGFSQGIMGLLIMRDGYQDEPVINDILGD